MENVAGGWNERWYRGCFIGFNLIADEIAKLEKARHTVEKYTDKYKNSYYIVYNEQGNKVRDLSEILGKKSF